MKLIDAIRADAVNVSQRAEERMVQSASAKHTPAEYDVGEEVIVRRFASSSKRKSTKDKWMRFVRGTVMQYNIKTYSYKVKYSISEKEYEDWFNVSDLTSLTFNEEWTRHHDDVLLSGN